MTNYCDCCKKSLWFEYFNGYKEKWAYPAETTKGRKYLCHDCLRAYNILDRFPNEKERNMDYVSLIKRREQDKKKKNK